MKMGYSRLSGEDRFYLWAYGALAPIGVVGFIAMAFAVL